MKNYFQAPWSLKDLLISISVSTGIFVIIMILTKLFFSEDRLANIGILGITVTFLLQWLIILTPIAIITVKKYGLNWGHFGLKKISVWQTLKSVVVAYLAYIGITALIYWIILYANLEIPGYQAQEKILPLFGTDVFSILAAGIIIVLLAPLIEEIVFRGFFLRTLVNKVGTKFGSVITALLFSLVHFPWTSIIPIFILGLIINSLVINTKSLWPAIVFHIFNNAIAFTIEVLIVTEVISVEDFI